MTAPTEDIRGKLDGHALIVDEDGWGVDHPASCGLIWDHGYLVGRECAIDSLVAHIGADAFWPSIPANHGRYPLRWCVNVYPGIPGRSATEYDVAVEVES